MDTLTNIVVSFPDTITIATTPKEVIFTSCPTATTQLDVALTHEITSTILGAILIIGIIVVICLIVKVISKYKEQNLRFGCEEKIRDKERVARESKDKIDSAWRIFNMCWKVEHPELLKDKDGKSIEYNPVQKLTPDDIERYKDAWTILHEWHKERSKEHNLENR